MRRRVSTIIAGIAALTALASCGYSPTPVPGPATASAAPSAAAAPTYSCDNPLQSYAPLAQQPRPGEMPGGSTMATIAKRGRLIAGVSADTYLLASRNPLTGKIEGFDISIVKAIAKALLGDENAYQLRVITASDRIPLLQKHEVDVVVRNMTINCTRWHDIAFSAEYYRSGQKLLVRKGSPIQGINTLAGEQVCAPTGTSSLDNLKKLAPRAIPVTAANHTGCLVLFQQGKVDAITGDDTVLAGLASQDPYAVVLEGKPFTDEPYGVGVPKEDVDLVRFVNGVLEQMRRDGSWQRNYDRWLAPTLGAGRGQPTPQYGRQR